MDESANSFGYWLRRRRKALDLTQAALAQKVSCSQAAIKKIESEERRPSLGLAQRLAEQLGIPPSERQTFVQAARRLAPHGSQLSDAMPSAQLFDTAAEGMARAAARAAAAREASAGALLAGAANNKPPFVGRAAEMEKFAGLVERLASGAGQLVLLQGEPGIGKSRLMHEVACHLHLGGSPVLATNCYEFERSIAFQPVIELATQACAVMPDARLRLVAPILLAELAALVPAVAARLPDLPALSADFPEARQARLFHALIQLFDAVATERPLLVFADNIHWADDASLRFLHFYGRQVAQRPVLLCCAFRDEEVDANDHLAALVESLLGEAHTRPMTLARLVPADTEALLRQMNDPRLSAPDLAGSLHRESGGNPFFLSSILHAISEGVALVGDTCCLPLPDALRDSVRSRLARVPQEDRALLEVAAVLGRRFEIETLQAITQLPEAGFLEALDTLVRRRLLREEPEGGFYDFSHDKVREVVYRDIGAGRRVGLHRLVAQRLEQEPGALLQERHAYLAEHFERGRVWPQAVRYLALAAERSQKLFAMREALQWFDRAVNLAEVHPGTATEAQQLALREQRGAARAQAGLTEGAVADFQRVVDHARSRGEHARARDVLIQLGMAHRRADAYEEAVTCLNEALGASRAMQDDRHVADTLYHLGTVAWSNGRNDLAIGYHQQAVDICEALGLVDLVAVQAFHGRGEAHFAQAQPASAIVSFTRSLALARAIGDRSYESENLAMIGWASTGQFGQADYPQALAHFDAALVIARQADLQWHLGPTLVGRASALTALGRCGEAWADLREALPRLETLRLVRYQMMAHDGLGSVLLDLDRPCEAAVHFEAGLQLAHGAGIRYWLPRLQADLALARLRSGAPVDRDPLQSAHAHAQRYSECWLLPRCCEALAELALAEGNAKACAFHAHQLLALASQGGMLELVGKAHRLSGLAAMAAGSCADAAAALEEALAQAEKLGCVPLSLACHGALAELCALQKDVDGALSHGAHVLALRNSMAESLCGSQLELASQSTAM